MTRFTAISVVAAAVFTASVALAETTWTNPAGGLWSDPANWSDGVPAAEDSVDLPELDGDGYVIQLSGTVQCAGCRVSGTGVALTGGMLQVFNDLSIGANGDVGELRLIACTAAAFMVRVGATSGNGTVLVDGASTLGGLNLIVADVGPGAGQGTCNIESGGHAAFSQITLGAGSTLGIEVASWQPTTVYASGMSLGGTLDVTLDESWAAPAPGGILILSTTPTVGSFAEITVPTIDGLPLPYTVNTWGVSLSLFDPLVSIALSAVTPAYVGFEHAMTVKATRVSGNVIDVTNQCDFDVASGAENVVFAGTHAFIPLNESPFAIHGVVTFQGQVMEGDLDVVANSEYPSHFERIDVNEFGDAGNQTAFFGWLAGQPAMSDDGRFVAFSSYATNLVSPPPPNPLRPHVYVKDRWTGTVERIDPLDEYGNLAATDPAISSDGRFVAFMRTLPGGLLDTVWVRDRWKQVTWLASAGMSGEPNDKPCHEVCIAADGSAIFYSTASTNLVSGVAPTNPQIFRHDLTTRTTSLVTRAANGEPCNGPCVHPSSSYDGSVVAFSGGGSNLGPPCTGGVVVWDAITGTFEPIGVGPFGCANKNGFFPSVSGDGSRVAFETKATNLGGTTTVEPKVYVRDRLTQTTTWVDMSSWSTTDQLESPIPVLSGDGQTLAVLRLGASWHHLLRVQLATMATAAVPFDPWTNEIRLASGHVGMGLPWLSHDGSIFSFAWIADGFLPFIAQAGDLAVVVHRFGGLLAEDINRDGFVDAADLSLLLAAWGTADAAADLDADGTVGAGDLSLLLAAWTS